MPPSTGVPLRAFSRASSRGARSSSGREASRAGNKTGAQLFHQSSSIDTSIPASGGQEPAKLSRHAGIASHQRTTSTASGNRRKVPSRSGESIDSITFDWGRGVTWSLQQVRQVMRQKLNQHTGYRSQFREAITYDSLCIE